MLRMIQFLLQVSVALLLSLLWTGHHHPSPTATKKWHQCSGHRRHTGINNYYLHHVWKQSFRLFYFTMQQQWLVFLNCKFCTFLIRNALWLSFAPLGYILWPYYSLHTVYVFETVLWRWTTHLWTENKHTTSGKMWKKVRGISNKLKQM
jgi:hypothetical protein